MTGPNTIINHLIRIERSMLVFISDFRATAGPERQQAIPPVDIDDTLLYI